MHIDMPSRTDIERIAAARDDVSVTIYLPTNTIPTQSEENRIRAKGLFEKAKELTREKTDLRTARIIDEHLDDLYDDSYFWRNLGRSLAVFVTPSGIKEYRLPNELTEEVSVTDRFTITPLMRAVTFPHAALVLAISQNGARLVEVTADGPAEEVAIADMPKSAEALAGVPAIGRAPHGRLQGDEGRKVRLTQYARAVEQALRPTLKGSSLPLIVAAAEPILSIFRNVCTYDLLLDESIQGNAEETTDAQLAVAAREILDRLYEQELEELRELFRSRKNSERAVTDLSELVRAAAFGSINTLAVDMDTAVYGYVDDAGELTLDESADLDVLEEIARRALLTGARVLSVRASDLPDGVPAAGILRFSA